MRKSRQSVNIFSVLLLLCGCVIQNSSVTMPAQVQLQTPVNQTELNETLIAAAFLGDVVKVKNLIAQGAIINAPYGEGDTASLQANDGGIHVASEKWTALHAAIKGWHDPAAKKGRLKIVRMLIEAGADLNADDGYGGTPLAYAVYADRSSHSTEDEDIALALISAGAKVNTKTGIYIDGADAITPLHRATANPVLLKALLANGADVHARDSMGGTPLHWACRWEGSLAIRALVEAGADVNASDERREIPLHLVCRRRLGGMIKLLIEAGADVKAENVEGDTAFLELAFASKNSMDIGAMKILLAAGANIDVKGYNGNTPLAIATVQENVNLVKFLLAEGANVNAQNNDGDTALHKALCCLKVDLARLLLSAGTDVDIKNNEGHTPLSFARLMQRDDFVEVLEGALRSPSTHPPDETPANDAVEE